MASTNRAPGLVAEVRAQWPIALWCAIAPTGVHQFFHARCIYCERPVTIEAPS